LSKCFDYFVTQLACRVVVAVGIVRRPSGPLRCH